MSTGATPAGSVPGGRVTERPAVRTGGPAGIMWMVITAVVALLVGAAGGYYLAPTKTVTTTVAPSAYTAGSSVHATAVFDGTTCSYSGPTELRDMTQLTIGYTATNQFTNLVLGRLSPGTTWEDSVSAVATRAADNPPAFITSGVVASPAGGPQQTLTATVNEGFYGLYCLVEPGGTLNKAYLVTMFRVTAR